MEYKQSISLALKNIIHFGDTDIFPMSLENIIFEDMEDELKQHFEELDNKTRDEFKTYLSQNIPINFSTACPVGSTGYRWATLIDPYWNVYFLSKVLQLAEKIESNRLASKYIYSYRFLPNFDKGSLFNKNIGWKEFQKDAVELCQNDKIKYVVSCDIADFYPRIYHHRLENALQRLCGDDHSLFETSFRITTLMQKFSETKSYGLPVGGPASRILAELALNAIDKLLIQKRVVFKRFVDDYLIFCETKEEAHSLLTLLNIKLIENEGLTVQKNKSVIMSKEEFVNITQAKLEGVQGDDGGTEKAKFLNLPVRYDPYSPNANEEYDEIKESLKSFDLFSMLTEELKKSKINQVYTRHILKALRYQDDEVISNSLRVIFQNIYDLYPIYNVLIQTIISLWEKINQEVRSEIFIKLEELHLRQSYVIQTDVNLAYTVKLLGLFRTDESLIILNEIFERSNASLIKKMVTQAMAKQNNMDWLSDQKNYFSTQNELQKRIFIVCSYLLGDEGKHWKSHNQHGFTPIQKIYQDWASKRKCSSKGIISAL
ncbi:RNA-directed DNA polymerase [Acinetobacter bereziniae]|uniref:RNA-directed DNA polymerase n=1 Tax=Acinetobacter bereziniae TaxID=106648 RepID=UPI0021D223E9|nr:RNA-directed DNA polymerase [Acinetobacter bereziniae]MCU4434483.1 RNA-directed DNA polymerase [Acinetobacter bereziniae]MDA3440969.1 RNA-directed DNA polymerase [Acinetobacter bereziniae]